MISGPSADAVVATSRYLGAGGQASAVAEDATCPHRPTSQECPWPSEVSLADGAGGGYEDAEQVGDPGQAGGLKGGRGNPLAPGPGQRPGRVHHRLPTASGGPGHCDP